MKKEKQLNGGGGGRWMVRAQMETRDSEGRLRVLAPRRNYWLWRRAFRELKKPIVTKPPGV